jgi:hypothetical protein
MTGSQPPFSRIFQLAYVTRDLAKAQALFERDHGVHGFTPIPAHDLELRIPAGATASMDVAVAWTGNWMIELIQPLSGAIDLYLPALPAGDGIGFHHIAVIVPGTRADWDAFRATVDESRIAIEGGREQMRFLYLDERDTIGHHVEHVWMSEDFIRANPIWEPAAKLGAG